MYEMLGRRSEDNVHESVLSFEHMGWESNSDHQIYSNKCLYPLSCLALLCFEARPVTRLDELFASRLG